MKKYNYMQLKNEQYFLPEWSFESHYESISSADLTNGLHYSGLHLNLQQREVSFPHFCVVRVYTHARFHSSLQPQRVARESLYIWGHVLSVELAIFFHSRGSWYFTLESTSWRTEGWPQNSNSASPPPLCSCGQSVSPFAPTAADEAMTVMKLFGLCYGPSAPPAMPAWVVPANSLMARGFWGWFCYQ